MASSYIRGGSDCILGKTALLKERSCIGTGCRGRWWSPHPWRSSKNVWIWHFGIWFSRHGGVGVTVGLDDLRGLFQPMILWFYGGEGDKGDAFYNNVGPGASSSQMRSPLVWEDRQTAPSQVLPAGHQPQLGERPLPQVRLEQVWPHGPCKTCHPARLCEEGKLRLAEMWLLQTTYWMEFLRQVEGVLPGDRRWKEPFCCCDLLDGWVNVGTAPC